MSAPYNPGQQPAGGQPSTQQPQYMGQPQMMMVGSHPEGESLRSNSTMVLILSILSIFFLGIFGAIPAWIWGSSIIRRAAELGIPEHYVSQAKIGKIIGMIITILWALGIAFILLIFFIIAGAAATQSGVS